MTTVVLRTVYLGILLALVAVGFAACSDASGPGAAVPTGLVLEDSDGTEVARYTVAGGVTGRITLDVGEQEDLHVHLVGATGERISVDGLRFTLEAGVVNSSLGDAALAETDEVVVTGKSEGSTTLRLGVRDAGALVMEPFIPLTVS